MEVNSPRKEITAIIYWDGDLITIAFVGLSRHETNWNWRK
jgi:hypothetical protein